MSLADFGLIDLDKEHTNKKEMYNNLKEKGMNEREAEMTAFKPNKLEKSKIKVKDTSIKKILFYFNSDEELDLVKKHFKILEFIELNNKNSDLLIALLRAVDEGLIKEEDIERLKPNGKLF